MLYIFNLNKQYILINYIYTYYMKKSELKNLTLVELKAYAKEKNIKKYSKLNKEELINYIINYKKNIKGGVNENLNSNSKNNNLVSSNTLISNINKKQKLHDCYNNLHFIEKFYLFYGKINVYFNLYKELYIKTKGKNATKNMTIFENENTSVYICKNIIKNMNKEFFKFLIDNRDKYKELPEENQEDYKNTIQIAIHFVYNCAVFTNDDNIKNSVCYYYPMKCGVLSGALRRLLKIGHKALNLTPHFSRPANNESIRDILKNIEKEGFDNRFLSLNEINLLAEIGKADSDILNEKSYKIDDKFLYNPIEKYCNNINKNSRNHSSTYIFIDPFMPYGPPYYGQPNYNPYYGPYKVDYNDPYYSSLYGNGNSAFSLTEQSTNNGTLPKYEGIGSGVGSNYYETLSKIGKFGKNKIAKIGQFNYAGTASRLGKKTLSNARQFGQSAFSELKNFNYSKMGSKARDLASTIGKEVTSINMSQLLNGLMQCGGAILRAILCIITGFMVCH